MQRARKARLVDERLEQVAASHDGEASLMTALLDQLVADLDANGVDPRPLYAKFT